MRLDRRADDGAVALLVAILATVLFGFAAIVVDLGYARTIKSDAQNTVDAASLAAAGILSKDNSPAAFTRAIAAIETSAEDNFGTTPADWAACSATPPTPKWVPAGSSTDCILFNNDASVPTKLQVVLPTKHVDSFFGGLIGYGGMDIGARAQATIREEAVPGCALCVQGRLDTSGAVQVDDGVAAGSGSSSAAGSGRVRTGGSITVEAPGAITFAATPNPASGPSYSSKPLIRPVTDPFAGEPMPSGDLDSPQPFPAPYSANSVTCGPGGVSSLAESVYRDITVTGPCTATGTIVVTGRTRGLRIRSGGSLSATSSVIQLSCGTRLDPSACTTPKAGGRLRIDAGGQLSVSATLLTKFSIVADPLNSSPMTISGALTVDQAIYGRSAAVTLQGTSASVSASGRVSVSRLTIGTRGAVGVSADVGGVSVPGPPLVGLFQ